MIGDCCCCVLCGRLIDYWQYHRNDIQSEYKGYCYNCEEIIKSTKKDKDICQKRIIDYSH